MIEKINLDKTNSWPFVEAKKILKEKKISIEKKGKIILQTGYGPSGLPHIGTFGEVVRTSMIVNALNHLTDLPKEIITFSDDMDGLRKVPENIPNKEILEKNLHKPLTSVPDPFNKFKSFGEHNNEMLKNFLDNFNFEYTFKSSTDLYKSGFFNSSLQIIMENYEEIMNIILPTLGKERQKTYCPFLPICPDTGNVLEIPVKDINKSKSKIVFDNNGKELEKSILDGNCKLQWKVDWAMRWMALGVDYEMCGKDLTESVDLASKICKAVGKRSPVNLIYEMFLDEKGEKISKSVGNGISVEEWLRYGSPESLSLFMYQKPKSAKKLFFDVIPKTVDEYISHSNGYEKLDDQKKFDSPVWHIHSGKSSNFKSDITFNSLTNLVSICNTSDKKIIWGFVNQYDATISPNNNPGFDKLIDYSINFYNDFVLPNKKYLNVNNNTKIVFEDIKDVLTNKINKNTSAEDIQTLLYDVGKKHQFENLKDFFKLVCQVLLGQEQGPRLGSFIKLYGVEETIKIIDLKLQNLDNVN